jgi:hypothetical protein
VKPFLERLHERKIPFLLLKGAALAITVYPDVGSRPMMDVDILIPQSTVRETWNWLEQQGWKTAHWHPQAIRSDYFRYRHAMDFKGPERAGVDLHWHPLHLSGSPRADAYFQEHAQAKSFLGIPVLVPDTTEQLAHACIHGIVWNDVPPVRWVADAMLLLQRGDPVDWDRLIRFTTYVQAVPYVHRALEFLKRQFGAPVPDEVVRALSQVRVRRAVQLEYARACAPTVHRSVREQLMAQYAHWRRSLGDSSPLLHPIGFVKHMQYACQLETPWALLPFLLHSLQWRSERLRTLSRENRGSG